MEIIAAILAVVGGLVILFGLRFVLNLLLTKGVVWAVLALGGPALPFWPVFVLLYVAMCVFGQTTTPITKGDK